MHSRRSYSDIRSCAEAELYALLWAVESMHSLRLENIIFEASFSYAKHCLFRGDGQVCAPEFSRIISTISEKLQLLTAWRLEYTLPARNFIASRIAVSVTSEHRYQSYVATGGPVWLHQAIAGEA